VNCPACQADLVDTMLGEARIAACEACGAALIANNQLVPLMQALAGAAMYEIDDDLPIEAAPKPDFAPLCPGCGRAMEAFGYLGSPLATLYRCSEHTVVFGDEVNLGTAALMYGRSNRRILERKSKDDAMRESWARSTRARAAGSAAASATMTGMLFGGIPGALVAGAVQNAVTKKGH